MSGKDTERTFVQLVSMPGFRSGGITDSSAGKERIISFHRGMQSLVFSLRIVSIEQECYNFL